MSFLSSAIGVVISTVKLVKDKASFTEVFMSLMTTLPKAVMDLIGGGKLTSAEKLDEALEEFDLRTGMDVGALDLIRDLPPEKEEIVMDHLKGMIEVLGKNKLKVPGYYYIEE